MSVSLSSECLSSSDWENTNSHLHKFSTNPPLCTVKVQIIHKKQRWNCEVLKPDTLLSATASLDLVHEGHKQYVRQKTALVGSNPHWEQTALCWDADTALALVLLRPNNPMSDLALYTLKADSKNVLWGKWSQAFYRSTKPMWTEQSNVHEPLWVTLHWWRSELQLDKHYEWCSLNHTEHRFEHHWGCIWLLNICVYICLVFSLHLKALFLWIFTSGYDACT